MAPNPKGKKKIFFYWLYIIPFSAKIYIYIYIFCGTQVPLENFHGTRVPRTRVLH